MTDLILPGNPLYDFTLSSILPPGWTETAAQTGEQCAFIVRSDSGIMEPATPEELNEYLLGGEYEHRLNFIGQDC